MSTFGNDFTLTKPAGANNANQIDDLLAEQWTGLDAAISLEHQSIVHASSDDPDDTSAAGRHVPGKVSVVFKGATTEISALTSVGTGALAYDTTTNELKRYDATEGWEVIFNVGEDSTDFRNPYYALFQRRRLATENEGTTGTNGVYSTRVLNNSVFNDIPGASLDTSTGIMTLPAGTYRVHMWTRHVYQTALQLYDQTNSVILLECASRGSSTYGMNLCLSGVFTLSDSCEVVLKSASHYNSAGTYAFGAAPTASISSLCTYNIFAQVELWKVS
jgi:hypothetical protein